MVWSSLAEAMKRGVLGWVSRSLTFLPCPTHVASRAPVTTSRTLMRGSVPETQTSG